MADIKILWKKYVMRDHMAVCWEEDGDLRLDILSVSDARHGSLQAITFAMELRKHHNKDVREYFFKLAYRGLVKNTAWKELPEELRERLSAKYCAMLL